MPSSTDNLGLRCPYEDEFFSINVWNSNMRILDEAYALLTDPSGSHSIPASAISFNNSGTGLRATNVQAALNELVKSTVVTEYLEVTVTEDITITVAANSHVWVVLHFSSIYQVDFQTSSGAPVEWEGGRPTFEANSTYELSFLKGNCKWFKR